MLRQQLLNRLKFKNDLIKAHDISTIGLAQRNPISYDPFRAFRVFRGSCNPYPTVRSMVASIQSP